MDPRDLREHCRALDIEWPVTLQQLDEARRLQAQVWHPDKHQQNEKLRLKGEEKLKRVNAAYDALRAYLLAGGGASCPGCGALIPAAQTLCGACQRQADLDRREKALKKRERDLRRREVPEPAAPAFVNVAGRWVAGACWLNFAGRGPAYDYSGGGFLGQTETGTAHAAGTTVTVRARNMLAGDFSIVFTVEGRRLYGVMSTPAGSAALEFWKMS